MRRGGSARPPRRLPAPRTTFIGRTEEVAALVALLATPGVRLVTLTGAPGIGKTRLALEVARQLAPRLPGGVAFVDLAPLTDPAQVLPAVAQALGVRDLPGQDLLETVPAALGERETLLLLDNFEQVLPAAGTVARLLDLGAGLAVLVTSRAPLRVGGEREFPVPPLGLPGAGTAEERLAAPAVALFLDRARAVRPDFVAAESVAEVVAELCVRLDGLPLAIELAAARVRHLPPPMILRRLGSRLDLLVGGRDAPPRHATLRHAIGWSYELLAPEERALFRRLAVFAGGCTLEAVRAVVAEEAEERGLLDDLAALVDNSLVQQEPLDDGEARFRMLETVRQFALEQLQATGEADAIARRHAAYYATLAEMAERALTGPEQAVWLERLEREHDNLRGALGYRLGTGEAEAALALAATLGRFWERHGYALEGLDWLRRAIEAAPDAAPALRARALNAAGNLSRSRGDYPTALTCYERTLALRREAGDERGVAMALNNLGVVAKDQGDYARARAYLEESLVLKRRLGEQRGVAVTLNNLGLVAKTQGDLATAEAALAEGLDHFRDLGDAWGQALTLNNMGALAAAAGDYERALALHKTSLASWRAMGEKWGVAESLEGLARAAAALGAPVAAVRLLAAAHRLRQETGFPLPPDERSGVEQLMAGLRETLRPATFAEAWAAGEAWSYEQALDAALTFQPTLAAPEAVPAGAVRVYLFGRFRLVVDGAEVPESTWKRPQALALFQYLMLQRHRYVPAEELVEVFWPQAGAVEATALYTTLSRIRRALRAIGAGPRIVLVREHAGYRLRLDPSVWVDLDAFTRSLATLGGPGHDGGSGDPDEDIGMLRAVLALYEDDLLPAVTEPWCLEEREALRRRYVEGALRLGSLLEERGDGEAAVPVYAQVVQREPLLEAGHRGLMRCYARLGRRDLALRQYQVCVEALMHDLGVAPEQETEALFQAIARDQPVRLGPQAARPDRQVP
jgi:non-specific serine/threonine protein kinase